MEEKDKQLESPEEKMAEEPVIDTPEEGGEEPAVEAIEEWEDRSAIVPKKKKKLSKLQIVLICVAAFIVLIGIAAGITILVLNSQKTDPQKPSDKELIASAPEQEGTISEEEQAKLDAALASLKDKSSSQLTAEDLDAIKERIAYLYNTANANKIDKEKSGQAITVLRGDGGADLMSVEGNMFVCGMKVQAGDQFYYQKGAVLYYCSVGWLQPALKGSLNQQERAYANEKNGMYKLTGTLKGDAAKIVSEDAIDYVPFVQIGNPDTVNSYNKTDFYTNGYYLDDPREITNFRIKKEYIVLDPSTLKNGEQFIEYNAEKGYYTCHFSLDITSDDCVKVAREYLRKSANSTDLQYSKFNVTLEVWENGYFKRMYDEEGWKGTTVLPEPLGEKSTESHSTYESVTYYAFDDELKKLFTAEDQAKYAGDDWAAKIIADYAKGVGIQ